VARIRPVAASLFTHVKVSPGVPGIPVRKWQRQPRHWVYTDAHLEQARAEGRPQTPCLCRPCQRRYVQQQAAVLAARQAERQAAAEGVEAAPRGKTGRPGWGQDTGRNRWPRLRGHAAPRGAS